MRMYKLIAIVVLGATFAALTFAAPALAGTGSGFVSWGDVDAEPGNAGAFSPHGSYATNTVKCAVCHAVHQAKMSGTQALLNSSVAEACTFCHISTNLSSLNVYEGRTDRYNGDNPYGHNWYQTGGAQGTKCTDCHQVHGASDLMTDNDYLTRKILAGSKTQEPPTLSYDARFDLPPDNRGGFTDDAAITEWCTSCHRVGDDAEPGDDIFGYFSQQYSDVTHVMKAAGTYAGDGPGGANKQVAWISTEYCSSCHSRDHGTVRWPHYSSSKRFLIASTNASGTAADITGTTKTTIDGVCLRCHASGQASLGVGTSY